MGAAHSACQASRRDIRQRLGPGRTATTSMDERYATKSQELTMMSVPSQNPGTGPANGSAVVPAPVPDVLARELHDSVAHVITRLVVDLERFHLDPVDPYLAAERMERMEVAAYQALHDLRQALDELGAAPATTDDLVPRLWMLLRAFEAETGRRAALRVSSTWPARLSATTIRQV